MDGLNVRVYFPLLIKASERLGFKIDVGIIWEEV